MNKTPHLLWCCAALTAVLSLPSAGLAQQPSSGNGAWYYQLGGASPISRSPNVNALATPLVGSPGMQLPRACDGLDPVTAISNSLGEVGAGVDRLDDLLVLAATEAIAALPAIILQRANPGLYDHFQGALGDAEQAYEAAIISCEQYVDDFEQGKNPFRRWVKDSKRDTWQRRLAEEGTDANEAEVEVSTLNGDEGILWLNGERRGGLDQDPLPIVREAAQAGYNLILGRNVLADGAPEANDARLAELFATTELAGGFAVDVLGDQVVQTCQGCTPGTVAAAGGLSNVVEEQKVIVFEALSALIERDDVPTLAELESVSSPTAIVTAQLIDDFRAIPEEQERLLLAEHMATDVAVGQAAEQGMKLRLMLLTSLQVPEIVNSPITTEIIKNRVAELEESLDNLLFEKKMQTALMSNTAGIINDLANQNRLLSSGELNRSNRNPQDLILQGRIRQD